MNYIKRMYYNIIYFKKIKQLEKYIKRHYIITQILYDIKTEEGKIELEKFSKDLIKKIRKISYDLQLIKNKLKGE